MRADRDTLVSTLDDTIHQADGLLTQRPCLGANFLQAIIGDWQASFFAESFSVIYTNKCSRYVW